MTKRVILQSLARKITGDNTRKCSSVRDALHCIAEKAKGSKVECTTINEALKCIDEHIENLIGGDRTAEAITIAENGVTNTPTGKYYDPITVNVPTGELKYHLYAWDYANGEVIAYSEKELPQAGDVVFLKEDMEGGKITDPTELKLIYHVVSDSEGVITVSEHPEGETGGYTFNRNEADDYEEEVTDVRDLVDITQNGFLMSQKGTMFKGANVNVEGGNGDNIFTHLAMKGTKQFQLGVDSSKKFSLPIKYSNNTIDGIYFNIDGEDVKFKSLDVFITNDDSIVYKNDYISKQIDNPPESIEVKIKSTASGYPTLYTQTVTLSEWKSDV